MGVRPPLLRLPRLSRPLSASAHLRPRALVAPASWLLLALALGLASLGLLAAGLAPLARLLAALAAAELAAIVALAMREHGRRQREEDLRWAEGAARAEALRYRALVEHTDELLLVLDATGVVRYGSPSAARMLGLPPERLVGRGLAELALPDDVEALEGAVRAALADAGAPARARARLRHADGSQRICALTCRNLLHDPHIAGVLVVVRDITVRANAEAALRDSETLSRAVFDALPAQIAMLDGTGAIVAVNGAWADAAPAGVEAAMGPGINYLELCRSSPDDADAAAVLAGLEAVLHGGQALFTYEYLCATPQGPRWYQLRASALRPGALLAHIDITERRLLEAERDALLAQLHDLAQTDGLTGLANRRSFMDAAQRAWQHALRGGKTLGLIMIDIDNLKQINDTYGHSAGDQVLRELAARCRGALRGSDLIGRYGGEEFAVLLGDLTPADAVKVAERVRQGVSRAPIAVAGHTLRATVSAGVVVGCPPDEPLELLLDLADSALYAAKHRGRNRVVAARDTAGPLPALAS